MNRQLPFLLAVILLLQSAAAARDIVNTDWSGFEKQFASEKLAGRAARVTLAGGGRVNTTVLGVNDTSLDVRDTRDTKQWGTGQERARIPRDQVSSVRFKGRMGSRGRLIGSLVGFGAGAGLGAAAATGTNSNEGPFAVLVPAIAGVSIAMIGLLIGYFIGRAADRPAPEFVIGR